MSVPSPAEIFDRAAEEGERRLDQSRLELAATSFIAGFTIVFGRGVTGSDPSSGGSPQACPPTVKPAGLAAFAMEPPDIEHLPPDARRVVGRCVEAAQAADRCAAACERVGDPKTARCIRACRDVADVASAITRLMMRGSGSIPQMAQVGVDACLVAADECAGLDLEICAIVEEPLREGAEALGELATGAPPSVEGDTMATPTSNTPWSGYFEPDQTT